MRRFFYSFINPTARVWSARAEFFSLLMLHNFRHGILCILPSCNSPESMVLLSCQEGEAMKTKGRELLEVEEVDVKIFSPS